MQKNEGMSEIFIFGRPQAYEQNLEIYTKTTIRAQSDNTLKE